MTDYALCGWRVASELPLPDLMPWKGEDRPADLTIRLGDVPLLTDPVQETPVLQVAADGTCRFEIAAAAAYRIDPEGREIFVAPAMAPGAPDIRLFLFGAVFAIVCFRRGLLPLHASSVKIANRAVVFSGPTGAGKSTLAAVFLARGYDILADDIAVIEPGAPGGPRLWPALPRLKLWRGMLDELGLSTEGLERVRARLQKYQLPPGGSSFADEPRPLAAVYHLVEAYNPRCEKTRMLTGVDAFLAVKNAIYRFPLGRRLLGDQALFTLAGKLAATVPSICMARQLSLQSAGEIADEILRSRGET